MDCKKCLKFTGRHRRGCENGKKFERLKLDDATKDFPMWKYMGFSSEKHFMDHIKKNLMEIYGETYLEITISHFASKTLEERFVNLPKKQ